MKNHLPRSYFLKTDVVALAADMIGKFIFTNINGMVTGGMIVETEAYRGPDDRGSHAYNDKRTPRNEMMYSEGGVVYMYICYGIHDMLNIVTGHEGSSHAVLIRAIEPLTGIDVMRERRGVFDNDRRLCQGPGALGSALGLNKTHNGARLDGPTIWMEDRQIRYADNEIGAGPRIGMNFEGIYRLIPWRFYVKGNRFVSRNNR